MANENRVNDEELVNFHENFKKVYTRGIRSRTLYNLILIDVALQFKLDNIKEDIEYGSKEDVNFNEYIRRKERINDIVNILGCSERTARDYRDALAHFHQ